MTRFFSSDRENAARHMVGGVDDDWSGVEKMTEK
jgi:hypothetical protein